MDSIVIGTAGHIDHGKTTLVKALTGFDTDTLEEEKRRGITINLGFAYCKLACGKTAGFVDVPGHERFVKNMLAGASGIDIAMIVIAASEGVMPQTREHINILGYLGIEKAIVVMTKVDTIDDEFRELVLEDTKDYLATTFLKDAPIVETDAITGRGIPELLEVLDSMAQQVHKTTAARPARLPIDRVFTVKGFGTVVTGTLIEGSVRLNDELEIYPQEIPVKVRGIQIHEEEVPVAGAGQRTALNLSGVSVSQIHRGSVVATRGSLHATHSPEAFFSAADDTEQVIKKMDKLKLYLGSAEVVVKVVPLDRKAICPGEKCYVRLLADVPVIARKGDRFVLRSLTPVQTVGGGRIVDSTGNRFKYTTEQVLEILKIKDKGTQEQILEAFAKEHLFGEKDAVAMAANVEDAEALYTSLSERGRVLLFQNRIAHIDTLRGLLERTLRILDSYHAEYPLRVGIPKAELQGKLDFTGRTREFEWLQEWMQNTHEISQSGSVIYKAGFAPVFSAKLGKIKEEMLDSVQKSGYSLLTAGDLMINEKDKDRRMVLEALLQTEFILLEGQIILPKALYEQAKETAVRLAHTEGAIRLSDFRDSLETSRKYALLLLEKMDSDGFTSRQGEERILTGF